MVNAHTNGDGKHAQLPDLSHHINRSTKGRQPNMLKSMYPYLEMPKMVSLGGGLPHPSTFPILAAQYVLPTPPNFDGSPFDPSKHASSSSSTSAPNGHSNGHSAGHIKQETPGMTTMKMYKGVGPNGEHGAIDLAAAQQYARPMGYLPLLSALRSLTTLLHRPQYDFHQIPTGGNTDASTKVFRALLEPHDTLLVEDFEFAPPIAAAKAIGAGVKGVEIDTLGIVPEKLDALLSSWDESLRGKKPHVMYTVPTGQNPTSATLTLERAEAVYRVAQKHDIIIVEDDPYFWLVMDPYTGPASDNQQSTPLEEGRVQLKDVTSLETFAKSLPRSYLSLDTDGRVLRLDSFSKCFAPGMRLGWLTGSAHFIERIQRIAETDSQEVNGLTQAFFAQLLTEPTSNPTNESWGLEGFARWICDIRRQYQSKRDRLVNGIAKACSPEHVRCKPVAASGMFLWLELNVEKHPDFRSDLREVAGGDPLGPKTNTSELIHRAWQAAIDENVLILESSLFASHSATPLDFVPKDPETTRRLLKTEEADLIDRSCFLRACFAGNHEQLDLASKRLGIAIEKFFNDSA